MILLFLVYCSVSEDEIDMYELTEADGDLQIVTECWVEPQYGVVVNSTPERQHWEGLTYKQIARAVSHFLVYILYGFIKIHWASIFEHFVVELIKLIKYSSKEEIWKYFFIVLTIIYESRCHWNSECYLIQKNWCSRIIMKLL